MKRIAERTLLVFGAAAVAGALAGGAANAQAPAASGTPAPPVTPRTPDGHPDLNGMWIGGGPAGVGSGADSVTFAGRGDSFVGFEADGSLFRTSTINRPQYQPQFWDEITDNEYNGNWLDPVNTCIPLGVPRIGAPAEIIAVTGKPAVILFYTAGFNGYGGSYESWDVSRWVWTDGRPHNLLNVANESLMGDAVGHWDGDTLVIESIGFSNSSWLHKNGWEHGYQMKVTEKLTRAGNQMTWQATVEDPEYLTAPWTTDPIVRTFNANPDSFIAEAPPCQVREPFFSHVRSG